MLQLSKTLIGNLVRGNLDRREDIHVLEAGRNNERLNLEEKDHLLGGRRFFYKVSIYSTNRKELCY